MGDETSAMEDYQRATILDSHYFLAHFNAGNILFHQKLFKQVCVGGCWKVSVGGFWWKSVGLGGVCGEVWVGLPGWERVCWTKIPVHTVNWQQIVAKCTNWCGLRRVCRQLSVSAATHMHVVHCVSLYSKPCITEQGRLICRPTCICLSIAYTVVSRKNAHGRSALQVCQREGSECPFKCFRISPRRSAYVCLQWLIATIIYNRAAGLGSSRSDGTQHSERQNATVTEHGVASECGPVSQLWCNPILWWSVTQSFPTSDISESR